METNLRQANAKVTVVGKVSEKNLEIESKDGAQIIKGTVTVKTNDTNFVQFNVYAKDKKNDGGDNPAYAGLVTVKNEYKSIADVGDEEADWVRVNGQLNMYHSQNGDQTRYRASFFTRIKKVDAVVPEASFEVETFIKSILPEYDNNGEETGRMKINGWVPTYNGIEPIELIVDTDLASQVESYYEPGQTVEFYGDIKNNRITKVTEKPVAFGKPKKEVKSEYVNELVVNGGSPAYEDEEGDYVPYNAETIRAAITEREHRIEAAKAGAQKVNNKTAQKPSGASRGRSLNW